MDNTYSKKTKSILLIKNYLSSIKNKIYYSLIFINENTKRNFKLEDVKEHERVNDYNQLLLYSILPLTDEAKSLLNIYEYSIATWDNKKYYLVQESWCGPGLWIIHNSDSFEEIIFMTFYFLESLKKQAI